MTDKPEKNVVKNSPTLKDRIHDIVEKYIMGKDLVNVDQIGFEAAILELIERVTHPQYFCPNCGQKMFYEIAERYFRCINCGHDSRSNQETPQTSTEKKPIPGAVEKMIQEAEKPVTDEIPRSTKPTAIGDKIRKLVDSRGTPVPTKEDEAQIKSADPNVRDINWS